MKTRQRRKYLLAILSAVSITILFFNCDDPVAEQPPVFVVKDSVFQAPDTADIPNDEFGAMVKYGRDLILNTAYYIGPEGIVSHNLNNKMNCTNCHLDAGTRPFGLNFFSTYARYPQYRGREDKILSIGQRINNCIERPHNGTPLPLDSKEIIAMVCYMKWLATGVEIGSRVFGDGGMELEYPDRPADVKNGEKIYTLHCSRCHGADGQGVFNADSSTYTYPPLWGPSSYASGSSLHRVLKAARFIKANMPDDQATWKQPVLTDIEAIDVAAFVNDDSLHPRIVKEGVTSYPNITVKPIDYHEGPFPDTFSAMQHKFGPYKPIIEYHKEKSLPVVF